MSVFQFLWHEFNYLYNRGTEPTLSKAHDRKNIIFKEYAEHE